MSPFPFLDLPLELRDQIYSLYFKPADRLVHSHALSAKGFFGGVYAFDFGLYRVNKQVYKEAKKVWQRENVFVKIATPWPSAGMYHVYYTETTLMVGGQGMYRVYLMSEEGIVWDEEGLGRGELFGYAFSCCVVWMDARIFVVFLVSFRLCVQLLSICVMHSKPHLQRRPRAYRLHRPPRRLLYDPCVPRRNHRAIAPSRPRIHRRRPPRRPPPLHANMVLLLALLPNAQRPPRHYLFAS